MENCNIAEMVAQEGAGAGGPTRSRGPLAGKQLCANSFGGSHGSEHDREDSAPGLSVDFRDDLFAGKTVVITEGGGTIGRCSANKPLRVIGWQSTTCWLPKYEAGRAPGQSP